MRWRICTVAILAACGRIGFDPIELEVEPVPPELPAGCGALPSTSDGPIVMVSPAMVASLPTIVASAAPTTTVLFSPGTYNLAAVGPLLVMSDDVKLRSSTGNPDDVLLTAGFAIQSLITINASRVVVADLTLADSGSDSNGSPGALVLADAAPAQDVLLYNLRFRTNQGINVFAPGNGGLYADRVVLACSQITFGDAGRLAVASLPGGCAPSAGIHVRSGRSWLVQDCVVDGFWCIGGQPRSIVFHRRSRDVSIIRNRVLNSWVGIRFGLNQSDPAGRIYPDEPPCAAGGYVDAMEGLAYNNIVYEDGSVLPYWDSGIALWQACAIEITHNTIATMTPDGFSGIEYRFPNSNNLELINNAVTQLSTAMNGVSLRARDGSPVPFMAGNIVGANSVLYTNVAAEDLRPAPGSPLHGAGDCAQASVACNDDYAGNPRRVPPDSGALESPP